jgi:hypothetical protein
VLHHVYTRHSILAGFGSLGIDEIHQKLVRFVHTISGSGGGRADAKQNQPTQPQYYVAVLDLEKCYDNVDTIQLFNLVRDLLDNKLQHSSNGNGTSNGSNDINLSEMQGGGGDGGGGNFPDAGSARKNGVSGGGEDVSSDDEAEEEDDEDTDDDDDSDDDGLAEFAIHKYFVSHRLASIDRSVTKSVRHLTQNDDMLTFREASDKIADHYNSSVLSDGVVVPRLHKAELLRLVHSHLFNHVVKMPVFNKDKGKGGGAPPVAAASAAAAAAAAASASASSSSSDGGKWKNDLFTQVKGIPQGSVLSPLLCNLYYGNAERRVFGSRDEVQLLGLRERSMIIRIMDDYIMISVDKSCVQHFLQRAHQALKPYGGGVNPLKTRVNFPSSVEISGERIQLTQIEGNFMPWCGYLVDTHTLEIRPSMERLLGRHLRFSITTECAKPARALKRALKSYVRMKCHALVLDMALNSTKTVFCSVFDIFLVAAMRMHAFIQAMKHFSVEQNHEYVAACIFDAILFGARLSASALRRSNRKQLILERRHEQEQVQEIHCGDETDDSSDDNGDAEVRKGSGDRGGSTVANGGDGGSGGSGCPLSQAQIEWLGNLAFRTVMDSRNGVYAKVKSILRRKNNALEAALRKEGKLCSKDTLQKSMQIIHTANWL